MVHLILSILNSLKERRIITTPLRKLEDIIYLKLKLKLCFIAQKILFYLGAGSITSAGLTRRFIQKNTNAPL